MNNEVDAKYRPREFARDFRAMWKQLVATDVIFKIIAFILLAPLTSILFRLLLAMSGNNVLADQDILFFLLGPPGWICLIIVGAVILGIVGLEQASLLGIIGAHSIGKQLGTLGALRFTASKAWPVLQVTTRIVAFSLVAMAPFLIIAGLVYFTLLTEFDINYYLKEKPPVFKVAVGIGAVLIVSMAALLLRLYSGWIFALPIVIFEEIRPSESLVASRQRAEGSRRTIVLWILGWALAMIVLSGLTTSLVLAFGHLIVPDSTNSLYMLVATIGITLSLWTVVGLIVNLITTISFSMILFFLYDRLEDQKEISRQNRRILAESAEVSSGKTGIRITKKRILAAGTGGLILAIITGVVALRSVPNQQHDVLVMAHRGSSKAAPENTMAAVRQAIVDGADWVEIDVQETADGHVVVFHDSDFMKLAGVDLKIWDATLDDLKVLDIGSWFGPEFKAERVPTLAFLLDECKGKINVNIELKYYGHDQQLEQRVADIVKECEMASNVILMSLKIDGVKKMKKIQPDWRVGLLMSVRTGDLSQIDADFLAVNATFINRRLVQEAHAANKKVFAWTVNDAPSMSTMIGYGVDALLTDKPALARQVIEQRAQLSAPQRLLLELAGKLGASPEISPQ